MKKHLNFIFLILLIFTSTTVFGANSETVIQTNVYWNQKPIKAIHIDQPKQISR